jgi:hypothetical protein
VKTQRESGFRKNMRYQSEPNLKERQLDQIEIWASRCSSPSDLVKRETYSRIDIHVSMVEEDRKDIHR